jgi:hypothetical protein
MMQRIFKIDNTPHQDRYLLEIDAQFVHLTRYLFGIKREEISRGHEDMAKKYPDYLQIPFEDWATLHTNTFTPFPNPMNDPDVARFNERFKERVESQPDNFFHEIHERIKGTIETTDTEVFNPILGFLNKNEYNQYDTERFSSALKNIIRINFEEISIEEAAEKYRHFENNFWKKTPEMYAILRKQYDKFVEDTDYGWFVPPVIKEDWEMEDIISFNYLSLSREGFCAMGEWPADDEHGFEVSISNDFDIELV